MSTTEPYFFEKYFPASYHLTFHPPISHHPGSYNFTREEIEKKSHVTSKEFQVFVDVKEFKPEEISVKTVNETIIVEGKQEKRPGIVPRHFVRHFRLPDFFDSEDVYSSISDDGILEVKALPSSSKKFRHLDELKAADTVNK